MDENKHIMGTALDRNHIGSLFDSTSNSVSAYGETPDIFSAINNEFRQGISKDITGFDIVKKHYSGAKFYGSIVTIGALAIGSSVALMFQQPEVYSQDLNLLDISRLMIPTMVSMVGSIAVVPFWAARIMKKFDEKRLGKYMESKDLSERGYYLNRVLITLIYENPKSVSLFDDTYTLAYTLWLYESFRELCPDSSNSESKKFTQEANWDMFKNDKYFSIYLDVAEDMNSGVLSRGNIPLHEFNAMDRKIIRKAKDIVVSRNSFKIAYANRFEEDARLAIELLDNGLSQEDIDLKKSHRSYSNDLKTLKEIESQWFATQNDIVQLLKFPMFSDIREPLVQSFHTKLSVAKSLSERVLNNDFVIALYELKISWALLSDEAQRIELSKFDDGERKKIIRATNLMNIALNVTSSPFERQSAYKKAMEQIKNLIILPKTAIDAVEGSVNRLEISA